MNSSESNLHHGRQRPPSSDSSRSTAWSFGMIQVVVLLGLALLQAALLVSGDSRLYQAPRMRPFLVFSTLAFIVLALHGLWTLRTTVSSPVAARKSGCGCGHDHDLSSRVKAAVIVLFGVVLAAGFLLPHQMLDTRVAQKKGISLNRSPGATVFGPDHESALPLESHLFFQEDLPWDSGQAMDYGPELAAEQAALREELGIWYDPETYKDLSDNLLAQEALIITGETFLDSMLIISAYLDRFAGRRVDFTGFVYHDGTMAENEMAVARIAVTCCLADATVYGLLVRVDNPPLPPNDTWVRVRGRITATRFVEEDIPMILADHLDVVAAPDQPYVYPRLYSTYVLETGP